MVTLESICDEVLLQMGSGDIPTYMIYARDALKDLQLYNVGTIRSVMLDIDKETNSAALPDDYITYARVGLAVRGTIIELDYDKDMYIALPKEPVSCAKDEAPTADVERFENDCYCLGMDDIPPYYRTYYYWSNIYYQGQELKPTYTIPAYYSTKFFKIERGRIWFNSITTPNSKVVMDYNNTGENASGQTLVEDKYKSAIKSYIKWKRAMDKRDNSVVILQKDYEREFYNLFYLSVAPTLLSLQRTIRSNTGQGKLNR